MHSTIRIAFALIALLAALLAVDDPKPKPDLTILYLNDVAGRLEVCDCYQKMPGGLARGAALIRLIRRDEANVMVVDSGDIVGARPTESLPATLGEAYRSFDCAAINLSANDVQYVSKLADKDGKNLPFISTNDPTDNTTRRHVISEVNSRKIAIFGVATGEGWRDPTTALREEIAAAGKDVDLVIVLSRLTLAQNRALAADVPGIDVIIGAMDASSLTAIERVGSTCVVPTSKFGQAVGRLDVRFGKGDPEIAWSRLTIAADLPKDEALEKLINTHVAEVSTQFASLDKDGYLAVRIPYAIEPECANCHGAAHLAWRRSRHSVAYGTLETKERNMVPDCLICHSEFYRVIKRPSKAIDAQRGIECATCHGDGRAHMADPKLGNIPRGDLAKCIECHDEERSPGFDPKTGWEKIKH